MDQCVRGHVDRIEVKPDGSRVCLACRNEYRNHEYAKKRSFAKNRIRNRAMREALTEENRKNAQNTP